MAAFWAYYTASLARRPLVTKMVASGTLFSVGDVIAQQGIEHRGLKHDPIRTLRLGFYGSAIFAPLAHNWLRVLEKVKLKSKVATIAAKVTLDIGIWGPFIVGVFWTANGLLEGKSLEEVRRKVELAYIPSYQKSVSVFLPTQILNFSLVPVQHRLLATQTVGLGWNIFLSYKNNANNLLLEGAAAQNKVEPGGALMTGTRMGI